MTSSMMAGERRWASARRGGMTVLGKVTVPKPVNLPSQRLENHGMDPTVEIVPKGTLSWGSRPSSSTSNAWGSSTLSPKADGGTSSPSHLSGRPSSGSGTRPSSSCSDRTHEPNYVAWGQSSRPSSASGALTSNQTSLASLRPRSAETRPGSSHLSRFAEISADNSVVWGPTGVSEKLGVASSKNDGFSLSSGDFPTLGSEKENSGKSTDSQDHGPYSRPGSSSRVASGKEKNATSSAGDNSVNANVTVNTWRRDGPHHVEDGMFQPLVEKWQGDPPPYLNANVPPQHFDAWRGPPLNPPGVWYRGPPGGPPYAPPLGPGGFPMEPFPYYRPQIPPPALVNSQPVPPPGAGPRGHHPKTGDIYRPHIPDGYVRPGMPIRPGFYPGPVPFEGYYGPPMGYCNSNERDYPYMGMPAVPPMYSRYPGENAPPDPGSNHARAAPHGPPGRALVSEQVESGHLEDARGPYKVLLKQHNDWDDKRAEDKWEHTVPDNAPYLGKGVPPRKSSQKTEWGSEDRKDGEIYSGRRILGGDEISSQNFDNEGRYSSDLPENRGKAKTIDHSAVHKSENAASTFSHVPRTFPATPKDSTLIQKIEGLNAKVRGSDGRPDAASVPSGEEQMSRSEVVDAKVNHLRNEAATGIGRIPASGNLVPASRELVIPTADNILHSSASSGTTVSRRASHGVQGRLDNRSKRFNTQDADGWRKKPLAAESTDAVLDLNSEPSSNVPVQDRLPSVIAAEKYVINLQEKDEGEFLTPMFDPTDCQEQRAKMREIAKQRALQLQKEEEERIREQKAKALAKLEELNRRTQAADGSHKIEKDSPSVSSQQEKDECQLPTEQVMVSSKSEPPTTELVSNANDQITKGSVIGAAESTDLSNATPMESSEDAQLKPVVPYTDSDADPKAAPQVNEGDISRHKRMEHKQRQNISMGDNLTDKLVSASSTEAQKNSNDVAVSDFASIEIVSGEVGPTHESRLPMNPHILAASSAHHRKKSNRISKNKHKSDEVPTVTALLPKESNAEKASGESGKLGASELELDSSLIQPSEQQRTSFPTEESSGRASSQWKSQHTRRMPKSHQANRNAEKDAVIWAPVRSDKKTEFIDKSTSTRTLPDTVTATAKGDKVIQNNPKSKRAEMERYVPKPVAKEQLAQQTLLDETVESSQTVNLTIGNIVCTVEPGNGNGKLNKQSKSHGSWQQRGSQDGSFSISDPSKNIKESSEQQQQLLQPEVNCTKETTKLSDDWPASDGWNISEYFDTAAPISSAIVKDQGVITGRGKRHPFKGHRNVSSGDTDKSSSQSPAHEIVGQTDKSSASKENRTTSHWQPKSQVYALPNQTGNRPGGGQSAAAEVRDPIKKDLHLHDRVQFAPDHKKEKAQHTAQPSNDQSVSEQKNEVVVPNVGHQESKREKKVASFTGQPKPPNQSSVVNTSDLVPPPNGDSQNELQRFSSGFRKNGNQNNRSGRVHESRGDWSLGGQDNRQHNNMSSNRERHRHNSHYEYQPIGQQNYSKSNNFEGPTDGSQNIGSRYRERSQGHSRRGGGNFSNWQGGTVRVDASYD